MGAIVNYVIQFRSPTSGLQQFGVSLENTFWTGPFQVGVVYRNGVVSGHFTYFSGATELLTMTLDNSEVYFFQNGLGSCASAGGEQGTCELIRQ